MLERYVLKTNNMTAVEWLLNHLDKTYHIKEKFLPSDWEFLEETSKAMEKEQSFTEQNIQDAYNTGYADAQTNHINDVNNYISELRYVRSK
jgi:hypothetical protein